MTTLSDALIRIRRPLPIPYEFLLVFEWNTYFPWDHRWSGLRSSAHLNKGIRRIDSLPDPPNLRIAGETTPIAKEAARTSKNHKTHLHSALHTATSTFAPLTP